MTWESMSKEERMRTIQTDLFFLFFFKRDLFTFLSTQLSYESLLHWTLKLWLQTHGVRICSCEPLTSPGLGVAGFREIPSICKGKNNLPLHFSFPDGKKSTKSYSARSFLFLGFPFSLPFKVNSSCFPVVPQKMFYFISSRFASCKWGRFGLGNSQLPEYPWSITWKQ